MEGHRQVPPSKRSKTPASWEADEIHDSNNHKWCSSLFSWFVLDILVLLIFVFAIFFSNPNIHMIPSASPASFVFWSTFYQIFSFPTLTRLRNEHSPALLRPGGPTSLRFFEEEMTFEMQSRFQLLQQSTVDGQIDLGGSHLTIHLVWFWGWRFGRMLEEKKELEVQPEILAHFFCEKDRSHKSHESSPIPSHRAHGNLYLLLLHSAMVWDRTLPSSWIGDMAKWKPRFSETFLCKSCLLCKRFGFFGGKKGASNSNHLSGLGKQKNESTNFLDSHREVTTMHLTRQPSIDSQAYLWNQHTYSEPNTAT